MATLLQDLTEWRGPHVTYEKPKKTRPLGINILFTVATAGLFAIIWIIELFLYRTKKHTTYAFDVEEYTLVFTSTMQTKHRDIYGAELPHLPPRDSVLDIPYDSSVESVLDANLLCNLHKYTNAAENNPEVISIRKNRKKQFEEAWAIFHATKGFHNFKFTPKEKNDTSHHIKVLEKLINKPIGCQIYNLHTTLLTKEQMINIYALRAKKDGKQTNYYKTELTHKLAIASLEFIKYLAKDEMGIHSL